MQTAISISKGNTAELTVTIPWDRINKTYTELFDATLQHVEVEGFRRGKAPRDLAAKHINKSKVYEETLKKIIPQVYSDLVKEHELKPISQPRIEMLSIEEHKDWRIKFMIAQTPTVKMGDYKAAIAKLKDKSPDIWVPGKEEKKKEQKVTMDQVLEAFMTAVTIELSPVLVEEETNRLLSEMYEELKKLGLTVDQYLQAQSKTSDGLRKEYTQRAEKTLALQFALTELAEKENITVEQAEIDTVINSGKTDQEKENLRKQSYYITSLLRRHKSLDFLMKLAGVESVPPTSSEPKVKGK